MLGLIPAVAGFFGFELEARHVTLSAGQLAAAVAALAAHFGGSAPLAKIVGVG